MTPFTSNKINLTVNALFKVGLIPASDTFPITEEILNFYIRFYRKFTGNGKFEWWYARKIAGVMLLKLNLYRGGTYTSCKEGIVYAIKNPAWSNHLKVGITIDTEKRLATFQTGDPFRAYSIDGYDFVLDRRSVEKKVFDKFNLDLEQGEWLRLTDSRLVLDYIKELIKLDL